MRNIDYSRSEEERIEAEFKERMRRGELLGAHRDADRYS